MNILPISEKFTDYAKEVNRIFEENDITGTIDNRDEKIGRKIRDSEMKKVPFMVIVGEKEQAEKKISVRRHGEGDIGTFTPEGFVQYFKKIIAASLGK